MITNALSKNKDYNDESYRKWIKRIPVYIFSLIWYFFIVGLIISKLIQPFVMNKLDSIDIENSRKTVLNLTISNPDTIGIIHKDTYASLSVDIEEGIIISYSDEKLENSLLYHLGAYSDDYEVFMSIESIHLDDIYQTELKTAFLDSIFDGAQQKWSDDSALLVYYNETDLGNLDLSTYEVFKNVRTLYPFHLSLINFLGYVVYVIPLLFFFFPKFKLDVGTLIKEKQEYPIGNRIINNLAAMIAVSVGLSIVSMLLKQILNLGTDPSTNQSAINSILDSNGAFLMIISAVVIGPLVEEIIFRKVIFGLIPNDILAIIVSSTLFGLVHVTSEPNFPLFFTNFIVYAGMGVFLGCVYKKNRHNLFLLYVIHALANLLSVLGSMI